MIFLKKAAVIVASSTIRQRRSFSPVQHSIRSIRNYAYKSETLDCWQGKNIVSTTGRRQFSAFKRVYMSSSNHQTNEPQKEQQQESSKNEMALVLDNNVRALKRELRSAIRGRLRAMTPEDIRHQSDSIFDRLFDLPCYQTARSVGLFLSMPRGEIMTDNACEQILRDQKTLYVPRVGLDFEHCDMDLIRVLPTKERSDQSGAVTPFHRDWPRNKWSIPEPPVGNVSQDIAKPGDIDLLVVPGLAFDSRGGRLGQGKGYYDRFIAKMKGDIPNTIQDASDRKSLLVVAVALEPSFIDDTSEGLLPLREVPTSSHDYPMDMVVLPSKTVVVSPMGEAATSLKNIES